MIRTSLVLAALLLSSACGKSEPRVNSSERGTRDAAANVRPDPRARICDDATMQGTEVCPLAPEVRAELRRIITAKLPKDKAEWAHHLPDAELVRLAEGVQAPPATDAANSTRHP